MASIRITELPAATQLNGFTDVIPVINNNITKKISINKILANGGVDGDLSVTGALTATGGFSVGNTTGISDFYISSTGNIGIGTENPNSKLTVVGSISAVSTTIVFSNLPTSAAGLPTGALYNASGFLKIV